MRQETAYLEGATPTKFGPKPLKRERGPSFSNINLDTKHTNTQKYVHVAPPSSQTFNLCVSDIKILCVCCYDN